MPVFDDLGRLRDYVTGGIQTLIGATGAASLGQNIFQTGNTFAYNRFPDDLGSSYYGHWMLMTAYTGGGVGTGTAGNIGLPTPNTPRYQVALPIPSFPGEGPSWAQQHDYAEAKLALALSNLADAVGVSPYLDAASTAAGVFRRAINPGVQVLYRSTRLRTFDFDFILVPKNQGEANLILDIERNVRYWSAPEKTLGGIVFNAPAEWKIEFWRTTENGTHEENTKLPRIDRCVIESVSVSPKASGRWHAYYDGNPHAWFLTFSVKEMRIITRDRIATNQGGNLVVDGPNTGF